MAPKTKSHSSSPGSPSNRLSDGISACAGVESGISPGAPSMRIVRHPSWSIRTRKVSTASGARSTATRSRFSCEPNVCASPKRSSCSNGSQHPMEQEIKESTAQSSKEPTVPTVAAVLGDHTIVEMLYRAEEHRTLFCVSEGDAVRYETSLAVNGERLIPYSPNNNLLTNEVVLLPSEPEEFDSEEALVSEIQAFIHRYVDVSPLFAKIAGYYVLLTWIYDAFSELPYLRLPGSLCCRP